MNRTAKNIISITLLIIFSFSIFFTANYALTEKEQAANNNPFGSGGPPDGFMGGGPMDPPPDGFGGGYGAPQGQEGGGGISEMPQGGFDTNFNFEMAGIADNGIQLKYYLLIGLEGLLIGLVISNLILTKFNKETLKETYSERVKIVHLIIIAYIIRIVITIPVYTYMVKEIIAMTNAQSNTNTVNLENAQVIEPGLTNLGNIMGNQNVKIEKAGEYILTGQTTGSITIVADGEVILRLQNLNLTSSQIVPIVNMSKNDLKIVLEENTVNSITSGDQNNSEHSQGVIYSEGNLTISGDGTLNIEANINQGLIEKTKKGTKNDDLFNAITIKNANLTITSGIINIKSNYKGIKQVQTGSYSNSISISGASLYINSEKEGLSSDTPIKIISGTTYIENNTIDQTTITYEIKDDATLICTNSPNIKLSIETKNNAFRFNIPEKKQIQPDETVSLIQRYENENTSILTFKVKTETRFLTICTSEISNQPKYSYSLRKGSLSSGGILINNVYYNTESIVKGGKDIEFNMGSTFSLFESEIDKTIG